MKSQPDCTNIKAAIQSNAFYREEQFNLPKSDDRPQPRFSVVLGIDFFGLRSAGTIPLVESAEPGIAESVQGVLQDP